MQWLSTGIGVLECGCQVNRAMMVLHECAGHAGKQAIRLCPNVEAADKCKRRVVALTFYGDEKAKLEPVVSVIEQLAKEFAPEVIQLMRDRLEEKK